MQVGRRIFFDKITGDVILVKEEIQNAESIPSVEQDMNFFIVLRERNSDSYDYIDLDFGAYAQEFSDQKEFHVDPKTKVIEFSHFNQNEASLKKQFSDFQNQFKTADEKYKEIDLSTADNTTVKKLKLAQLQELCTKTITEGFDFTVNSISYRFSCSLEAQANFQGADTLFKDSLITQAEWTVLNNSNGKIERILLNKTTFDSIKLQVFTHINSNISRLRNTLQPQVEAALTNQDIDKVVW
jgi:hypothetical protein